MRDDERALFFLSLLVLLFCIRSSALRHLGRISSMTWKPQPESRSQQEPAGNRMDCVDKSRPLCHDVLSQQNPAPDKQKQQPRGGERGIAEAAADAADAKIRYKLSFVAEKRKEKKETRYIAEGGKRPLRGRRCGRTVTFSGLIYAME